VTRAIIEFSFVKFDLTHIFYQKFLENARALVEKKVNIVYNKLAHIVTNQQKGDKYAVLP